MGKHWATDGGVLITGVSCDWTGTRLREASRKARRRNMLVKEGVMPAGRRIERREVSRLLGVIHKCRWEDFGYISSESRGTLQTWGWSASI